MGALAQGDRPRGGQGGQFRGDKGGVLEVEHGPQAKRGVPYDGPASKDENDSPGKGKGKDKKIKSESKHHEGIGRKRTLKLKDANAP